jgi:hypothetical protein
LEEEEEEEEEEEILLIMKGICLSLRKNNTCLISRFTSSLTEMFLSLLLLLLSKFDDLLFPDLTYPFPELNKHNPHDSFQ